MGCPNAMTLLFSNLTNRKGTCIISSADDWLQIRNHELQLLVFHVFALQWKFPLFCLSDNERCTLLLHLKEKKLINAVLQDAYSQQTRGYQSTSSTLFLSIF